MGEIVTYKNEGASGVYSQIRLDSGERVLLSMAQSGFRVSKLLLGTIPTQTIWDIPQHEILSKLTDPADPQRHPLDVAIARVKDCKSIEEVRSTLVGPGAPVRPTGADAAGPMLHASFVELALGQDPAPPEIVEHFRKRAVKFDQEMAEALARGDRIPPEKRQDILHHVGHLHATLVELRGKYPLRPDPNLVHIPEGLLPYSRGLILKAIAEELQEPEVGATLREMSVERWVENLKAMDMVLMMDYVENADWVKEFGQRQFIREQQEKTYLKE